MAQQVYELTTDGVYGLKGGVYADTPYTIIDDFGDGPGDADISEYGGNTGAFSVQTSVTAHGSHALTTSATSAKRIASTTGLPNYPAQGDRFRASQRFSDAADNAHGIIFAAQSATNSPNGYYLTTDPGVPEVRLERFDGAWTTLASKSFTPSNYVDEWVIDDVTWKTDGTITVDMMHNGSVFLTLSATDTTWASGGVGWFGSNNSGNQYFDFMGIH